MINGTEQERAFILRPGFLTQKSGNALVVSDGEGFSVKTMQIRKSDTLQFTIPATGGLVFRIKA